MQHALTDHIRNYVTLQDTEVKLIASAFKLQSVKKKENLLEEGRNCDKYYFVSKGCLRLFIVNTKGNEQTLQFAIENWWMTDHLSFENQKPSGFYIQAVEASEVLFIDKKMLDELLMAVPALERYFRKIIQTAFGATQMRIKFLYTQSAEERYHYFNSLHPEFVQRIPQYMLASYLDFSPELMSKIRAGKV